MVINKEIFDFYRNVFGINLYEIDENKLQIAISMIKKTLQEQIQKEDEKYQELYHQLEKERILLESQKESIS